MGVDARLRESASLGEPDCVVQSVGMAEAEAAALGVAAAVPLLPKAPPLEAEGTPLGVASREAVGVAVGGAVASSVIVPRAVPVTCAVGAPLAEPAELLLALPLFEADALALRVALLRPLKVCDAEAQGETLRNDEGVRDGSGLSEALLLLEGEGEAEAQDEGAPLSVGARSVLVEAAEGQNDAEAVGEAAGERDVDTVPVAARGGLSVEKAVAGGLLVAPALTEPAMPLAEAVKARTEGVAAADAPVPRNELEGAAVDEAQSDGG